MKTLAELVERVRRKADQENSSFVTDDEIRDDLNFSIGELYDLILSSYSAEYFVEEYDFATVSGTESYDLPSNFYKLAGLDIEANGGTYSVPKYNFSDRNVQKNSAQYASFNSPIKYRLYGSQLKMLPAPSSVYQMTLHYAPQVTELVLDADTTDVVLVDNWLEYAVIDVAIKIGVKEETDVGALIHQKNSIKQRITEMKENRDFANPEVVRDVYSEDDFLSGRYVT